MNTRHGFFMILTALMAAGGILLSCSDSESDSSDDELDVRFWVPSQVSIVQTNPELTFRVLFEKAPKKSDNIYFTDVSGNDFSTPIVSVSSSEVTVNCSTVAAYGTYTVNVSRGSHQKSMGQTVVSILDGVEPEAGSTVYGKVTCDGEGVEGVVISDGVEVVQTDADGVYQMASAKKYNYVFISTPSGYETATDGVLPVNYVKLTEDASTAERADFVLYKSEDQTNHTLLVFGDMHMAGGRNSDRKWFSYFCSDVNDYIEANSGDVIYGMTLGDMTWDYYWYSNNYQFEQYLADVNSISNLTIYHTIGNHDHDMMQAGDYNTILKYISLVAPDFYSFNIGNFHYVVLDNILCTNTGQGRDYRTYDIAVTDEEIAWLKKDLAFVSTSTPLIITMHAPYYQLSSASKTKLSSALSGYNVNLITGHTHKIFNQNISDNIFDHNSGAVCSDWWTSVSNTSGKLNIGTDGSPAGFQIFKATGTSLSWQFKPTQHSTDYQFRTYDRNQIDLSADNVMPDAADENKTYFNTFASPWTTASTANEVYINVFNFASGWKLEVTEDGTALTAERVEYRDPLHILTSSVKYMTSNAKTTYYTTAVCPHLWKVTASSATSTLKIKVTDNSGNVYEQTMTRPKTFSIDEYADELNEY